MGVTDLTDSGALAGRIFVLDYNSNNASPDTKAIYDQMIGSMSFNQNALTDKEAIIHDTKRIQDLVTIGRLAEKYKTKNGSYPNLAAGSYIPGVSTSTWPSWTQTLGTTLGQTLPTDPINTFNPTCVAPYESSTCWAESLKKFRCPTDAANGKFSHIYAYVSDGNLYNLYTKLEYNGAGKFQNYTLGTSSCPAGQACGCFDYVIPNNLVKPKPS
ncbi:MAG: hypothetical protein HY092_02885 [Candidatus Kerfeldbacteria bacterium]|nr:hypothetical protein [Candidatus Kerfeldbacteria bacterium]